MDLGPGFHLQVCIQSYSMFITETQIILWMESSSLPIHQSYSVQGDLHIHIFYTLGKHFLTSKSSYTTKSCFTSKSLLSNCMCLIDFQVLSFQEGEVGRVGLQPQCGRLHRIPDFLRQALFNTTADHSWNISFVRARQFWYIHSLWFELPKQPAGRAGPRQK